MAVRVSGGGEISITSTVTLVKHTSRQSAIDSLVLAMSIEAQRAIKTFIEPGTPKKTGLLRTTLRSVVWESGGDVTVQFIAGREPDVYYPKYLELPEYVARIRNLTTPGTRVPFLEPGVEEAMPSLVAKVGEVVDGWNVKHRFVAFMRRLFTRTT